MQRDLEVLGKYTYKGPSTLGLEISCTEEPLGLEVQNADKEGCIFDAEPRKD